MLIILAAQLMAPPPPVFVPAPLPPVMPPGRDRVGQPRTRIGIVLRGGGRTLWDGDLWVAARGSSSWRQTVQEPTPEGCPGRQWDAQQNEISVQLSPGYESDGDGGRMTVTVRWARPGSGECDGVRTVELRQTVSLKEPGPIVLRGDGGLIVELSRR